MGGSSKGADYVAWTPMRSTLKNPRHELRTGGETQGQSGSGWPWVPRLMAVGAEPAVVPAEKPRVWASKGMEGVSEIRRRVTNGG